MFRMKLRSLKLTPEQQAYDSYLAYCQIVSATPLALEAWRSHHQRLFGNSPDRVIASTPVRGGWVQRQVVG
jgi:hypothetical protein